MSRYRKLINNLLNPRLISVLGSSVCARYVGSFMLSLPQIIREGSLCPFDRKMGMMAKRFHYEDTDFLFDCKFCDERIRDGSFAFGIAREIYIRNCYFRFHRRGLSKACKTVLDLGANRGAFSTLMASTADFVISVEAQAEFIPVIKHNMQVNGFTNYAVECGFVGTGGILGPSGLPQVDIEDLLDRYHIETADFVKIDIEGSEFAMFESPEWLRRVNALSMELHHDYGDPRVICEVLTCYGFEVTMADVDLHEVGNPEDAGFLYAVRTNSKVLSSDPLASLNGKAASAA